MKKIYYCLICILLMTFSAYDAFAQPHVVRVMSIDSNSDGITDAIEIQFDVNISDASFVAGSIDNWDVSNSYSFSAYDICSSFSTNVTELTGGLDNDSNDEYVTLSFTPNNITSSRPIYFRFDDGPQDIVESGQTTPLADIPPTPVIDIAAPGIASITAVTGGTTNGILKVGEKITFTLDVVGAETGLTISETTYNGGDLNWNTTDGGDTYIGIYTVSESDALQHTPLAFENVTLTDANGNTGASADASGITKGVDPSIPIIDEPATESKTSIAGDILNIGDTIQFVVTPQTAEIKLDVNPKLYNGQGLIWENDETGSYYYATYTVDPSHDDQLTPINLVNVTLTDSAGNESDPYSIPVSEKIDATYPSISSKTSFTNTIGALKLGDSLSFTVTTDATEYGLKIYPSKYNSKNITWSSLDGQNFTALYIVESGDISQPTPLHLHVDSIVDVAGNKLVVDDDIIVNNAIDAVIPEIISVAFNPTSGIVGSGVGIDVTISAGESGLVADTLIINNTYVPTEDLVPNGTDYDFTYTVSEGDDEVWDSDSIPIYFVLRDPAGNLSIPYTSNDATACPGIDSNTPVINNVTSDATSPGILKVGDKITFTVDIAAPDGSLIVNSVPSGYNGQTIDWFTTDGGDTYKGVYTVTEGEDDQDPAIPLENVTVTDLGGNESTPPVDCTVNKTIDANSPVIDTVIVMAQTMLYDVTYTVTVNVESDGGDLYNLVSGKIAGFDLYNLQRNSDISYSLDFDVGNLGYDILDGESYNITNLVLSDPAGNLSNSYSNPVDQLGDPIYTILPTAKVTNTETVCHGDSVDLIFQLTGNGPWEVILDSCSTPITVDNITESPYIYKVYTNKPGGGTDTYKITQVTDNYGNVKLYTSPEVATITINGLPGVSFSEPVGDQTYNVNAEAQLLKGNYTEGDFSGIGVYNNDTAYFFSPKAAGEGGPYEITYAYEDQVTGCSNSTSVNLTVISSNAEITFEDGDALRCNYETSFEVYGQVIDKPTITGDLLLPENPTAITSIGNNASRIDITQLNAGNYTIYFAYDDGGQDTVAKSFTIDSISTELDFTDIPDQCADYDTIFINTVNRIPSGGSGVFTFSGSGSAFEYDPADLNNNSGYLLPGEISDGLYSLTYEYTTVSGCTRDTTKEFNINALPDVSFALGTESTFNIDQGSIIITGSPADAGGEFTSTLEFIDDNEDGTAIIDPNENDLGSRIIIYTYTNSNGCVEDDTLNITVNKADGTIESSSGTFQFCYYGSTPVTFTGTPIPTDNSPGTFYIDDNPITTVNNQMVFNPQDYTAGYHQLIFKYKNNTTPYEVYQDIDIDSIGDISFTGLDPAYCEDQNSNFPLSASPPTGNVGTIAFAGNGISNVSDEWYFNPSVADKGTHEVTYTFERDYSGCSKEFQKTTVVNRTPLFTFYPLEKCIVTTGDSISFKADTTLTDSVVVWDWKFRNIFTSNDQYPRFPPVIGSNAMELTVTTNKGCSRTAQDNFYIGTRVDLEFTFENECHGETVQFNLVTSSDPLDTLSTSWDFGGAGISDLSDHDNPTYKYVSPGAYDVVYKEELLSCGIITDTVRVNVRPSVDLSLADYLQEFEDEPDAIGWVVEDLVEGANNTWQWGVPSGSYINTASSGTHAFVTNLTADYKNDEQGMVTSPCFDFSSLERPMMKMDFISLTESDRDGAVIQYTKPNGDWATIGVPNDGVNWYNSYIITGAPANQQLGWTGELYNSTNSGWKTAMFRLDELRGRGGVRFRIVFGSNGDFTNEGFAFDNIWFGERQRLVLLENFTNNTDNNANDVQSSIIDPILEKDSLDVISLNYHTSFPAPNNFNAYYPSGPSARALYYGVSGVPYSFVDGARQFDYSLGSELNESDIHSRVLIDPQFNIKVQQDIQSDNFVISATIKAAQDMTGNDLNVFVAVVERTLIEGGEVYHNVLRTMLPDAAGVLVEKDWITGDSVIIQQSWPLPNDVHVDSLITIVFVQDEESKDIYQTAFSDKYSTITSTEDIANLNSKSMFRIYPNPAKNILTVEMTYINSNTDLDIQIYNNTGKLVYTKRLLVGSNISEINIEELPTGLYYLKAGNSESFTVRNFVKVE